MHRPWTVFTLLICVLCGLLPLSVRSQSVHLSDTQADKIGRRLWQNECGGTISGLTSWNEGEDFASLGIGHFIWYPAGRRGPFEESFPPLVQYLEANGRTVPDWMRGSCPWTSREHFMAAQHGDRLDALRRLLT